MKEGRVQASAQLLTVSMKATMGLIISFIIFFVVITVPFLLTNPFDIGAFASLLLVVPYSVFLAFCWKRKPWAYLASMILAIILLVGIPLSLIGEQQMPALSPLSTWELLVATVLSMLIALESFKAYTETKRPQNASIGGSRS